jgi:hypothetical protein
MLSRFNYYFKVVALHFYAQNILRTFQAFCMAEMELSWLVKVACLVRSRNFADSLTRLRLRVNGPESGKQFLLPNGIPILIYSIEVASVLITLI